MTINDIARIAKVSMATVSRVINNQPVRESTKQRVLAVIARYEYYPNAFAQYLGRRKQAKYNSKTVSGYSKFKKSL